MFTIYALTPDKTSTVEYYYDPHNSTLVDKYGNSVITTILEESNDGETDAISSVNPGKKTKKVKKLKISLGLSCNYSCEYCSQRFVPHADSTTKNDIDGFLDLLFNTLEEPDEVQFWGGEPFVYWKTLKPLAEQIRTYWKNCTFLTITNGTLLDEEKIEWLDKMDFCVGVSHDGPGYHVRGEDPLFDPEKKKYITSLVRRLKPKNKISFNAVLHKNNKSRADIQHFITSVFGNDTPIGEGSYIDAYDEGGMDSMLDDIEEHFAFRRDAVHDIRTGQAKNFDIVHRKIKEFVNSIRTGRKSKYLGQKCGMDREDNLAVDLNGNIVTCQNVSAAAIAPNGNSHKIGHLSDLGSAELSTVNHWKNKTECNSCPVLQLCKGSCMFLEGNLWKESCNAAYSDNVAFLVTAIEYMTGNIPIYIEGEGLPDERKDIFNLEKKKYNTKKSKFIPINPI